jgi:hypothetical protein
MSSRENFGILAPVLEGGSVVTYITISGAVRRMVVDAGMQR